LLIPLGHPSWGKLDQTLSNNTHAKCCAHTRRCMPTQCAACPHSECFAHTMSALPTQHAACRALAISVLLKDTARLEQERAAFANKRQVYKGFSREQLSNGAVQRTHSADSMDGPYSSAHASHNRQQVVLTLVPTMRTCCASCALPEQVLPCQPCSCDNMTVSPGRVHKAEADLL